MRNCFAVLNCGKLAVPIEVLSPLDAVCREDGLEAVDGYYFINGTNILGSICCGKSERLSRNKVCLVEIDCAVVLEVVDCYVVVACGKGDSDEGNVALCSGEDHCSLLVGLAEEFLCKEFAVNLYFEEEVEHDLGCVAAGDGFFVCGNADDTFGQTKADSRVDVGPGICLIECSVCFSLHIHHSRT